MYKKNLFFPYFILAILMGLIPMSRVQAQTYTSSATSWTGKPSSDVYWANKTFLASTSDGGTYIMAKAIVNSDKTITFYFKKNSGTFQYSTTARLLRDVNTSSEENKYFTTVQAGASQGSIDVTPDFTSGSHSYTFLLKSGNGVMFCTRAITITAKTVSTLTTPDYTTFTASSITKTGFTAKWSAVSGATKYNINVKKASETDYNNPSFTRSGITTNSVSVTGLDPGTEYQFQIQAANGTSTSSWSKSSSSTFKTLADLTITNGTYFGTTTLTKGVPYTFKATIKNNASVAWKGGIYLKSGSEDIDKTGLSLSAGSSSTVTLSYTPTTTGSKTFTLYYLTNDNGSGVVINGGNYSNPFTVTIQAPQTLATPDYTTFTASSITKTGFTAKWSAVSGATKYNINVKKASETDYNNPSFTRSGITTNSVSVTGLDPGTEYQFQIQAANGTSTSSWSKSSSSTFKTLADLTITNGTYFGTTTLTKGVPYTFKATIKNNASVAWKGGIYLKSGSEDIDKTGLSLSAGSSSTVTLSYTPTTTGSKTFTLYYLTNDNGSGVVINGGNYSNPFTVTIQAPSTTPNLSIAGGSYFNTTSLTLGKAYTFAIKVKNNGTSAWNGSFYLKNGSEDWLSWGNITIEAGATKTLTDSYTPKTAGNKTLTFYYQTGNSGDGVPVSAGSYQNPFSVTVTNPSVINPSTPSSPSPSDGSTNVATSGTFSWSTAANDGGSTLNYDLYVDYNSSFSNVSKPYRSGSGKSCSFSGLNEGNTYYWKVIVYNGSGGHAASPVWSFTTKAPSTTKLATPTNVRATNPTSSSFRASWGAVSGATKYLIYVYQVGKTTAVYTKTVATTYTDISGLSPSTSYYFEVKAKNDDIRQNSEWSSKSNTITTTSPSPQSTNLTIFKNEGFDGSTKMIVGQSYHYSVIIKNNGSETWKGSFYLKEGTTNVHPWYGNSIPSTWGQPLECDYTPKTAGSHTLTLYYQTGGSGDGVPMGNITVNAIADPTVNSSIKLKEAITCPNSIVQGNSATIVAKVQNGGSDVWSGILQLSDGTKVVKTEPATIGNGGFHTLYANWTPSSAGLSLISVNYKTDNETGWKRVESNGFSNPISVSITSSDEQTEIAEALMELVSKNCAPSEVNEGDEVFYYFRVTDKNGKPLKGIKAKFQCSGSSTKSFVETDFSDENGYAILSLSSSGSEAFASRGEKVRFVFSDLINQNNKSITWRNANSSNGEFSLKLHKGNSFSEAIGFENVQSFAITIDRGLTGEAKFGSVASASASLSFPLKTSLQWSDGKFLTEIESESKLSGNASLNLGDYFDLGAGVEGGLKESTTYNWTKPERTALAILLSWFEATQLFTSSNTLKSIRAIESWFGVKHEEKEGFFDPILENEKNSAFWALSGNGNFKSMKSWPNSYGVLPGVAFPQIPVFTSYTDGGLKFGLEATFKCEPLKREYNFESSKTLYGISRQLKGKFSGNINAAFGTLSPLKGPMFKPLPSNSLKTFSGNYEKSFLNSISANAFCTLSTQEEEMYTTSNRTLLEKISNTLAVEAGIKLSSEYLKDYLCPEWMKENTSASSKASISIGKGVGWKWKISSQGAFARDLQSLAKSNPDFVNGLYPALGHSRSKYIIEAPTTVYEMLTGDHLAQSLQLVSSKLPGAYSVKDAFKVEMQETDKAELIFALPLAKWGLIDVKLDCGISLDFTYYPSVSYYSFADERFLPVVARSNLPLAAMTKNATAYLQAQFDKAFGDDDKAEIGQTYVRMNDVYGRGSVAGINTVFTIDGLEHYYTTESDAVYTKSIHRRRPLLAEQKQTNICTFTFTLNDGIQNFEEGVNLGFSHFYPAGDLLGITEQGDTLFVVSEVCDLSANEGTSALASTQTGKFKLESSIGADDLTPFGFREDQALDVYYSEAGSDDVWQYVGPAGTPLEVNRMGKYMMATSIKNDPLAPVVEATLYDDTYTLHIHVSDNIAVRTSSLRVFINGESREFTMLSESDFEVQLTSKDVDYMMTVFVTANDLAGNQGRLFQMFNLDKPDSIEQIDTASEKQAKIHLNKSLLKVENAEPNITVTLFSLKGEVIAKGETDSFGKVQIRLNCLPAGIYIATLSNGKSQKFSVK